MYINRLQTGLPRSSPGVPRRKSGTGLRSRLESHWFGRRSGDQFCVYVADRLVLSTLSGEQITAISAGELKLDALVRMYVHAHLTYRFCELPDSKGAETLEREVRRGTLRVGQPFLNPLHRSLRFGRRRRAPSFRHKRRVQIRVADGQVILRPGQSHVEEPALGGRRFRFR